LPPGDNELLFFLHVPKTAGISLTAILDANFGDGEIFEVQDWREVEDAIDGMSAVELARVRCVRGHYWFGPGDAAVHDRFSVDPVTITVLRDPVARTVSAYQHVMRWEEHWLRGGLGLGEGETMPLGDFVEHPLTQGEIANLQTRLVVGMVPGNYPELNVRPEVDAPLSDAELLAMAKARLDSFAWVGVTERLDEAVGLLTAAMGWQPVDELPALNVNPVPSATVEVPAETRAAILERAALDCELYAYAGELLERRLRSAEAEAGPTSPGSA
jgi:Sulfotransferase family